MEKELIKKLNILKEKTQPRAAWKKETKEFLLSQISNLEKKREISLYENSVFTEKKGFFSIIHQPAWAVFCILLIIIGGGAISARAARNIKPGNSLYIARIISEKAQVAMVFNKEKKARLDMKFAHNHAKEITEVLADSNFNRDDNKVKVAKLNRDFKQELGIVKEKIEEINKDEEYNQVVSAGGIKENSMVRSVDFNREENGLNFYSPDKNENKEKETPLPAIPEQTETRTPENGSATSEEATSTESDIFTKAEETLLANDFEGTRNILEQINEIMENIDKPDNKESEDASEERTSTTPQIDTQTANSTSTGEN